ncbi:MAG: methionyl-tRNA formyltransferase [Patescibacteria group bacterium]|nr:methionyl-tRNA formyltransferase [Patescibacteria group bacterium]
MTSPGLKNYRLIFFGSSLFGVPILSRLHSDHWQILAVVTQPDRPKGRTLKLTPTPVKVCAKKLGLPVFAWENLKSAEVYNQLKGLNSDFAVVAAYGQLIPENVLSTCRKEFLNVHPSLLPRYRGPTPIQFALLNGEKTTGVSIIILDAQMDHGPILAQKPVAIEPDENYQSLHDRLSAAAADLTSECVRPWITGTLRTTSQDDRKATYTKLLSREDGRIFWKKTADEIARQVRAYTPWPGAWSTLSGERIKLLEVKAVETAATLPPGTMRVQGDQLIVGCGNYTALAIDKLQPENRRAMGASAFLKGRSGLTGSQFS